jgi:hypothetical protein
MRSTDFYLAERTMNLQVREAHSEAEARGLAREAGIEPYGRLARRGACWLALLLVAVGGRLVQQGLPPHRPAEADLGRQGGSTSPA